MTDDLNRLRVNVPRMLKFRGNVSNLKRALVNRITAGFLESLQGRANVIVNVGEDACQFLLESGLIVDDRADRIGVTRFGNSLLFENGSHFEYFMLQNYETQGYRSARNRIENLANGILGAERLDAEVAALCQATLSRMDHYATTLTARRQWLAAMVDEMSVMLSEIERECDANRQQYTSLERDLGNAQRSMRAEAHPTTASGRFTWLRTRLTSLVKNRPEQQSTNTNVPSNMLRGIEEELLRTALRENLLQSERSLIGSLLGSLRDEEQRIERAGTQLDNAAREKRLKCQTAEMSRGWTIAAGEVTLNDSTLTEAVVHYLWGDCLSLWELLKSKYAEFKGQDIFVNTEGVFTEADFEDIESVVRDHVDESLQDWTLVDFIAARYCAADGLPLKIMEAFRQIASRDFLTLGYDRYLPHRTYAIITYAQSQNPRANDIFDSLLEDWKRVLDADPDIENDHLDSETITFYIEDQSVPITAMEFFAKSSVEYETSQTRNNPLYTPHPDIYGTAFGTNDQSLRIATPAVTHAANGVSKHSGAGVSRRTRILRNSLRTARRENAMAQHGGKDSSQT